MRIQDYYRRANLLHLYLERQSLSRWCKEDTMKKVQIAISVALVTFIVHTIIDWYQWQSLMVELGRLPLGLWGYLFNIL